LQRRGGRLVRQTQSLTVKFAKHQNRDLRRGNSESPDRQQGIIRNGERRAVQDESISMSAYSPPHDCLDFGVFAKSDSDKEGPPLGSLNGIIFGKEIAASDFCN
jgi:hypothetical protein